MADALMESELGPCRRCGLCIQVCEAKAIVFKEGRARIVGRLCVGCSSCVHACPLNAEGLRSSLYNPLTGTMASERPATRSDGRG